MNSKGDTDYIRTPAHVISENPLKVYSKLTLKHDVLEDPRNRKQVHDKKYNDKKKKCIEENGAYTSRSYKRIRQDVSWQKFYC